MTVVDSFAFMITNAMDSEGVRDGAASDLAEVGLQLPIVCTTEMQLICR